MIFCSTPLALALVLVALQSGTRLRPYEILSLFGSGGMGEVYRARDLKLNRDVAIQVLPEHLARDAGRLARLQREAQLLAALNHPHIAHIHGLEDSTGVPALVLELVKGPTLADNAAHSADLSVVTAEATEAGTVTRFACHMEGGSSPSMPKRHPAHDSTHERSGISTRSC